MNNYIYPLIAIIITITLFCIGIVPNTVLILGMFLYFWIPKFLFIDGFLATLYPSAIARTDPEYDYFLTIDDLPDSFDSLNETLNVLDKHKFTDKQKVILFVISDYVDNKNRPLLIRAIQNGYIIANHGKSSAPHFFLSYDRLENYVKTCDDLINDLYKEAGVKRPKLSYNYRPHGALLKKSMFEICKKYNYDLMMGTVYPHDFFMPIPYINTKYIEWKIEPHDIIVLHDRVWTAKTLQMLFDRKIL